MTVKGSHLVFRSRRFVRAWFLLISIPSLLVLIIVGGAAALRFTGWLAVILISLLLAMASFVLWWVVRGWFVGMWISRDRFIARGWVKNLDIARSGIAEFERVDYGGHIVWMLAIEPPLSFMGDLTVVRVRLRDGSFLDVQSSFANPLITYKQVKQLNLWLVSDELTV